MHDLYRVTFIVIILLTLSANLTYAKDRSVEFYMPDGQFVDHPIRVYVSGVNDTLLDKARLCLVTLKKNSGARDQDSSWKDRGVSPRDIGMNHRWQQKIKGSKEQLTETGALLLFDFSHFYIPWYYPGIRVQPVLHFGDNQLVETIVADEEIYVSHLKGCRVVTFFSIIIIIIPLLLWISKLAKKDHHLKGLISTQDGRMSISLCQMFLWTVAVGTVVLATGLTRLRIPNIPQTLLVLMGFSVMTSVTGHAQTDSLLDEKRKQKKSLNLLHQSGRI